MNVLEMLKLSLTSTSLLRLKMKENEKKNKRKKTFELKMQKLVKKLIAFYL